MCLICNKGRVINQSFRSVVETIDTDHSQCIKQFDSVKKFYQELIAQTPIVNTLIPTVDESINSKRITELELELNELKIQRDELIKDNKRDCLQKEIAIKSIDKLLEIANLTDQSVAAHKNFLIKCGKIVDENWSDIED
jgi:UDP-N-acetylmuramate-alanine ligase